ncbi:MAG: thrombospondin type 3 repeat-containing protein [Pseudomonadota bacterium]
MIHKIAKTLSLIILLLLLANNSWALSDLSCKDVRKYDFGIVNKCDTLFPKCSISAYDKREAGSVNYKDISGKDYEDCAIIDFPGFKEACIKKKSTSTNCKMAIDGYDTNKCLAEKKIELEDKIRKRNQIGSYSYIYNKHLDDIEKQALEEVLKRKCTDKEHKYWGGVWWNKCREDATSEIKKAPKSNVSKDYHKALECLLLEARDVVTCWLMNCTSDNQLKHPSRVNHKPENFKSYIGEITKPDDFKIYFDEEAKTKGFSDGIDHLKKNQFTTTLEPKLNVSIYSSFGKYQIRFKRISGLQLETIPFEGDDTCTFSVSSTTLTCSNVSPAFSLLYDEKYMRPFNVTFDIVYKYMPEERLDLLFPFFLDPKNPLLSESNILVDKYFRPKAFTLTVSDEYRLADLILNPPVGCISGDPTKNGFKDKDRDGVCDIADADVDGDGIINLLEGDTYEKIISNQNKGAGGIIPKLDDTNPVLADSKVLQLDKSKLGGPSRPKRIMPFHGERVPAVPIGPIPFPGDAKDANKVSPSDQKVAVDQKTDEVPDEVKKYLDDIEKANKDQTEKTKPADVLEGGGGGFCSLALTNNSNPGLLIGIIIPLFVFISVRRKKKVF